LSPDVRDHIFVTVTFQQRRVPAGEFRAGCFALLDEVATTGACIVVTKRGKPVARVLPLERAKGDHQTLRGSVVREGDLVSPIDARWKIDP
jgi:prevent-host-death family protein